MKVLHINKSDITGGAAIAVYRLHQGLLAAGIDSRLMVDVVATGSKLVASIPRRRWIDGQIFRFTKVLGLNDIHITNTAVIANHPFYQEADILHFHNLHGSYFNYLALPSLTNKKPAILTLHDMWGFTGHCAYSFDCDRWKIGCGKCPYPDTYPAIKRDNTQLEWKLKHWSYHHTNLTAVVTTSRWLEAQVQESMLSNFPIHCIPYSIDTEVYQPLNREQCRSLLGIPADKKVLMFAAQSLTNPRKGGDLLLQALAKLPQALKTETILLTLGNGGEKISEAVDIKSLNLGYVSSDRLKAIAYSAADLFLFPTRSDAFGLVAQEAMACATPVIGFNVGGVPDLVRPGNTGYLAKAENPDDFSQGIIHLLGDKNLYAHLGQQCRHVVLTEYALELQAREYINLYRKALT
jgi:glycosyltransferase involved in cell wall biosynthesis